MVEMAHELFKMVHVVWDGLELGLEPALRTLTCHNGERLHIMD